VSQRFSGYDRSVVHARLLAPLLKASAFRRADQKRITPHGFTN
jgi:hypothetical protein